MLQRCREGTVSPSCCIWGGGSEGERCATLVSSNRAHLALPSHRGTHVGHGVVSRLNSIFIQWFHGNLASFIERPWLAAFRLEVSLLLSRVTCGGHAWIQKKPARLCTYRDGDQPGPWRPCTAAAPIGALTVRI